MPYDSCFRILRSKLCALVVVFVALGAPAAYSQENGSPGAGGPNFTIYPRLLSSPNGWSSIQREPPCLPINSAGTITLTLDDCPNPRNPRRLGSPAYWQINLTGNSTLAVVNQAIGQVFRIDIVANGFTLALPSSFVLPAGSPAVNGNSFITCEVHDINTYWCPGGMQVGLVGTAAWALTVHQKAQAANNPQTAAINTSSPAANFIAVGISYSGGAGTISDTASNTFTQAGATQTSGSIVNKLFYVYAPTTSATHQFTCTASFCTITVAAFTRTAGGTQAIDTSGGNISGAATSIAAGSLTPAQPNELAVTSMVFDVGGSGASVTTSGYTTTDEMDGSGGVAEGGGLAYFVVSAATNPSWGWAGSVTSATTLGLFK